ncbi:SGNH/GDSL hydrolase family protein [Clostridium felsineum]|uniref:SGNH/GDSL hydrolase family protein n=1 Tax=Clostridium felsineum TaxID=36839 RepID=UPI00098BEACA|nr:SGNH/GDSL hydrolase family protein [Clostridium felsineum]URZ01903.1 Cellulase/esterase CelE [Clostridium felsineum]
MKKRFALLLIVFVMLLNVKFTVSAYAVKTINSKTSQSLSKVLFIGRVDTSDPAGPKFAWSDTTIKANFKGTGISVNLKSAGDNWFNVIVDGKVQTPINVSTTTLSPIVLASGLTQGKHSIELVKRTEASVGEVQFLGFNVTEGKLLSAPKPSDKRIMFVGDSITCGYGNEGTSQYQSFTTKNENAYLAYGAVTARLIGADSETVCWSGKGLVRNYGGNTTDLMPDLYDRILPYNTTLLWDSSKWIPQVVVINLGTNDFSIGAPDKTVFTSAYLKFISKIRGQYPKADIYCAVGPMLNGDNLTQARDYVKSTVDSEEALGDKKVHFIEFPMQDPANGYGEDWHPTVKTHEIMANQLANQIKADLGWNK